MMRIVALLAFGRKDCSETTVCKLAKGVASAGMPH
jgi:hypothetical protein